MDMKPEKKRISDKSAGKLPSCRRALSLLAAVGGAALMFCSCGTTDVAEVPEADYIADNEFMQIAIDEAREGIYNNHGGPFGSVIVMDGEIIGQGHNMVLENTDSTAHGEVSAIRDAEANIGSHDLSGAVLYTTGEPCPMCLAACMWANIDKVYYGCTIEDNAIIGFRDEAFDSMFGGREAFADYLEELDRDACLKLFDEYVKLDRERY